MEVARRLMPHLPRHEARRRAWASLRGLLSPVDRTNGWQLAEGNGATTPYGGQPLVGRARWEAEAVRDALCARDALPLLPRLGHGSEIDCSY